jgi:ubiquinone/menaquinone biosynthesis C-methylase UbiE
MKMGKLEKKFVNSRKREERNIRLIEHYFSRSGIDTQGMNRVLDIGCGVGFVAIYLKDKYDVDVVGIDVDPEQIECAEKHRGRNEELHFTVADATRLPFEDNHFDMVLSFMVVHHIGDWRQVLEEVSRVLKPEGTYILHEITYPGFMAGVFRSYAKKFGIFTADELLESLDANDFHIVYEEKKRQLVFRVLGMVMRKGPGTALVTA